MESIDGAVALGAAAIGDMILPRVSLSFINWGKKAAALRSQFLAGINLSYSPARRKSTTLPAPLCENQFAFCFRFTLNAAA